MRSWGQHVRFLIAALSAASVAAVAVAAEPRVDLEVATEPGFLLTDAGRWNEMLTGAGFSSVRIRGGKDSDRPGVEALGSDSSPTYRVVGVLTSDGKLVLPRGRFGVSDRAGVEQWLGKLRQDGIEGITIKPAAFGLLPRQLVAVHQALAAPVSFSTTGQKPRDVAKRIAEGLSLKFITDPAGQRALATDEPVADELQGLSSGTALAAILRPLGLVLVPEKTDDGEIRLRIADSRAAREHWPVGWPPKGTPAETLPDLFKFLNIEISDRPISEVLQAISKRLKTPILIDHNSLARHEIELTKNVDLPRINTFYAKALDRVLVPNGLKYELRVDEANKPLLWITTVRQ